MIKRALLGLTQPTPCGRDVVLPYTDTGDRVTGCPGPGPGPERLEAGVRLGLAAVAAAPAAGEHAIEHPGVKVAPEVWQRFAAADDAVEGQDQRHRSGVLEARAPRDLGGKIVSPLRPPGKPAVDERFDIVGVAQRLQVADSMGVVPLPDDELLIPRAPPAGENDPPRERVGLTEPLVGTMSLVEGVDHQLSRRVALGEKVVDGLAQPGAAHVTELVERARHGCCADVAACAE